MHAAELVRRPRQTFSIPLHGSAIGFNRACAPCGGPAVQRRIQLGPRAPRGAWLSPRRLVLLASAPFLHLLLVLLETAPMGCLGAGSPWADCSDFSSRRSSPTCRHQLLAIEPTRRRQAKHFGVSSSPFSRRQAIDSSLRRSPGAGHWPWSSFSEKLFLSLIVPDVAWRC